LKISIEEKNNRYNAVIKKSAISPKDDNAQQSEAAIPSHLYNMPRLKMGSDALQKVAPFAGPNPAQTSMQSSFDGYAKDLDACPSKNRGGWKIPNNVNYQRLSL
jgi:hypothetical protein